MGVAAAADQVGDRDPLRCDRRLRQQTHHLGDLLALPASGCSSPSSSTDPLVGLSSRARPRSRVDFPQPLAPMITLTLPVGISTLSSETICRSPYPSPEVDGRQRMAFDGHLVQHHGQPPCPILLDTTQQIQQVGRADGARSGCPPAAGPAADAAPTKSADSTTSAPTNAAGIKRDPGAVGQPARDRRRRRTRRNRSARPPPSRSRPARPPNTTSTQPRPSPPATPRPDAVSSPSCSPRQRAARPQAAAARGPPSRPAASASFESETPVEAAGQPLQRDLRVPDRSPGSSGSR